MFLHQELIRAVLFGLAAVIVLDAAGFESRRNGARVDAAVIRAQVRFWTIRSGVTVACAVACLLLGHILAIILPLSLAPVLLAAAALVAYLAASAVIFPFGGK